MPKFLWCAMHGALRASATSLRCGGLAGDLEVEVLYTPGKGEVLARGKGGRG